jgi:antitoxin (DNA-binding transcriptional repressor) of toxin-antitoxin stability system
MTRPIGLEARGESVLAMMSPIPVARMIPINRLMNAMNGRMFLRTWSTESRPA